MAALAHNFISPEQYLEFERNADFKSEYLSGEMFAMAGTTRRHSEIVLNAGSELRLALKGRPCGTSVSDLKVRVSPTGLYTYPDVVSYCDAIWLDEREDVLLNPAVIFEVLSPSTRDYDRGEKFVHYRTLDSLTDYVLVSQDRMLIEHFARQGDDWLLHTISTADEFLRLESLAVKIPCAAIYDGIDFPAPDAAQPGP